MSELPNESKYRYYWRRESVDGKDTAEDATQLSRERIRPSRRTLDYLVHRARATNIDRFSRAIGSECESILDIGGRIQPYRGLFARRCDFYIGVDPQLGGLTDVVAIGECLPFSDASFSVVLCTQVLTYVNQPDVMFAEILRVLKPGGYVVLTAPAFFPEHFDEKWRFLPGGLESLAKDFNVIDISPEGFSPAGLFRAVNILFHAEIRNWRIRQAASWTTIPLLNVLGALFDRFSNDTRCTANYDLLAQKPPKGSPGATS
jgi:SAM-dependent methyltransferase